MNQRRVRFNDNLSTESDDHSPIPVFRNPQSRNIFADSQTTHTADSSKRRATPYDRRPTLPIRITDRSHRPVQTNRRFEAAPPRHPTPPKPKPNPIRNPIPNLIPTPKPNPKPVTAHRDPPPPPARDIGDPEVQRWFHLLTQSAADRPHGQRPNASMIQIWPDSDPETVFRALRPVWDAAMRFNLSDTTTQVAKIMVNQGLMGKLPELGYVRRQIAETRDSLLVAREIACVLARNRMRGPLPSTKVTLNEIQKTIKTVDQRHIAGNHLTVSSVNRSMWNDIRKHNPAATRFFDTKTEEDWLLSTFHRLRAKDPVCAASDQAALQAAMQEWVAEPDAKIRTFGTEPRVFLWRAVLCDPSFNSLYAPLSSDVLEHSRFNIRSECQRSGRERCLRLRALLGLTSERRGSGSD